MTITKSKSVCFKLFMSAIDDVLSKIHNKDVHGEPLTQQHDEWHNARERLLSIKVGGDHFGTYPANFQLADHLILSELACRENPCKEHYEMWISRSRNPN